MVVDRARRPGRRRVAAAASRAARRRATSPTRSSSRTGAALRVVAALTEDEAALYRDGEEVAVPEEMLQALLDGFTAVDAVVEGHVTTAALRSGEGAFPEAEQGRAAADPGAAAVPVERQGRPVRPRPRPRGRDGAGWSPSRSRRSRAASRTRSWRPTCCGSTAQPLDDVPLLERKRLLEAVLTESFLVRVSAFVRPSAVMTLVSWGTLGFERAVVPRVEQPLPAPGGSTRTGRSPRRPNRPASTRCPSRYAPALSRPGRSRPAAPASTSRTRRARRTRPRRP